MQLFNTMTREKEEFVPLEKGKVKLYTCGPTVYWYAHIGNLRTYIFEDILKRTLIYNGYSVFHVMNITDVGHLTSDADAGEDKLECAALREKKSVWEIARMYEECFRKDISLLNILPPDILCRATEHIAEQLSLIEKLEEKGFTYDTGEVVYFDTSKFPGYGKFANLNLGQMKPGARVELDLKKKNPYDFALWFKTVGKRSGHIMRWPSKYGEGWPGWHIECSAMAMKYLGETLDIHCGGVDHIQIHHTNEIAQSEAATGKQFARFWLHGEFLMMGKKRMGKSEKNFATVSQLIEKGYSPLDFRYLCLTAHYRDQQNFTWESLTAARNTRLSLIDFLQKLKSISAETKSSISFAVEKAKEKFSQAINNDLNMPLALAAVHELVCEVNVAMGEGKLGKEDALLVYKAMKEFDSVFGVLEEKEKALPIPKEEIEKLLAERDEARKRGDFSRSDEIRAILKEKGILLEDTKEGQRWKVA